MRSIEQTVALPTAELDRPIRRMALYRFNPPLLARILYHRQHGSAREQRATRYIQALLAAYQPFAEQVAPRLAHICRDIGRPTDAERYLRLLAPPEQLTHAQATLAALRALAATDPHAQHHLLRYILKFASNAHGRLPPRPLLPLLYCARSCFVIFCTGVHAYGTDNDENATGADFDSADCGQPLSAVFRIHASIFTSGQWSWMVGHRLRCDIDLSRRRR